MQDEPAGVVGAPVSCEKDWEWDGQGDGKMQLEGEQCTEKGTKATLEDAPLQSDLEVTVRKEEGQSRTRSRVGGRRALRFVPRATASRSKADWTELSGK